MFYTLIFVQYESNKSFTTNDGKRLYFIVYYDRIIKESLKDELYGENISYYGKPSVIFNIAKVLEQAKVRVVL